MGSATGQQRKPDHQAGYVLPTRMTRTSIHDVPPVQPPRQLPRMVVVQSSHQKVLPAGRAPHPLSQRDGNLLVLGLFFGRARSGFSPAAMSMIASVS
jgi:hypothetical protein